MSAAQYFIIFEGMPFINLIVLEYEYSECL